MLGAALAAFAGCRAARVPSGSRPSTTRGPGGAIPAAAFFADPVLSNVMFSPDGKRLAAVSERDGVAMLIARPTRGGAIQRLAKLDEAGLALRNVGWANNDMILVGLEMPRRSAAGRRGRRSRLMAVPLDGRKARDLGEQWPPQECSQYEDQVIAWLPDDPRHVLINYGAPDQPGASAAAVDVETGALRVVVHSKPWVLHWFADHEGRVRAGEGGQGSWIVYATARATAPTRRSRAS